MSESTRTPAEEALITVLALTGVLEDIEGDVVKMERTADLFQNHGSRHPPMRGADTMREAAARWRKLHEDRDLVWLLSQTNLRGDDRWVVVEPAFAALVAERPDLHHFYDRNADTEEEGDQ